MLKNYSADRSCVLKVIVDVVDDLKRQMLEKVDKDDPAQQRRQSQNAVDDIGYIHKKRETKWKELLLLPRKKCEHNLLRCQVFRIKITSHLLFAKYARLTLPLVV